MLAELGHDVTVVTSAIPSRVGICNEKFSIIRVPAFNILEAKLGVPYPIFGPRIFNILDREIKKAEIVNGHGYVYVPVVIGAQLARHYKKPFVLTQHNTFIEYKSSILRGMQHIAGFTIGKATINCAVDIVCVSGATQDYVNSIKPVASRVHYNGIDINRFKPSADIAALRRRLSIPVNKTICFCIRRITFKNGIDTLLEVADLLRSRKDVLFIIGGKGPDFPAAQEIVKQKKLTNVRLLGMVSDKELPNYYAASDIFILPSKKGEGFPLVVLEALASGIPVIATRSGGHTEIIETGKHGYIVEPEESDKIAEHIVCLTDQPTLLEQMKKYSRRLAVESLSWEKNVEFLLRVFEGALS
jgi:glycosyltransferase involved in cell wall biosynthesis